MSLSRLREYETRLERRQRVSSVPLRRLKDRLNPLEHFDPGIIGITGR